MAKRTLFTLLIEAVVIGLLTVVAGTVVSYLYSQGRHPDPEESSFWPMINSLFLTGFSLHLVFEALGWNLSYCKMYLRR